MKKQTIKARVMVELNAKGGELNARARESNGRDGERTSENSVAPIKHFCYIKRHVMTVSGGIISTILVSELTPCLITVTYCQLTVNP